MQKSIQRGSVKKLRKVFDNTVAALMAIISFMAFNAVCTSKFNFVNHLSVVNLFISLMPVIIFTGSVCKIIKNEK